MCIDLRGKHTPNCCSMCAKRRAISNCVLPHIIIKTQYNNDNLFHLLDVNIISPPPPPVYSALNSSPTCSTRQWPTARNDDDSTTSDCFFHPPFFFTLHRPQMLYIHLVGIGLLHRQHKLFKCFLHTQFYYTDYRLYKVT